MSKFKQYPAIREVTILVEGPHPKAFLEDITDQSRGKVITSLVVEAMILLI